MNDPSLSDRLFFALATPREAIAGGADFPAVGRPLSTATGAARRIARETAVAAEERGV